jgi:hypothetical protein
VSAATPPLRPVEIDGPAHPWVAVVERFGAVPPRVDGDAHRVIVFWWHTRAGRQPVLLVRRIRHD